MKEIQNKDGFAGCGNIGKDIAQAVAGGGARQLQPTYDVFDMDIPPSNCAR